MPPRARNLGDNTNKRLTILTLLAIPSILTVIPVQGQLAPLEWLSATSNSSLSASTLSLTGISVTAGNNILILVATNMANASLSDTETNYYTQRITGTPEFWGFHMEIWTALAGSDGTVNVTITLDASDKIMASASVYSGLTSYGNTVYTPCECNPNLSVPPPLNLTADHPVGQLPSIQLRDTVFGGIAWTQDPANFTAANGMVRDQVMIDEFHADTLATMDNLQGHVINGTLTTEDIWTGIGVRLDPSVIVDSYDFSNFNGQSIDLADNQPSDSADPSETGQCFRASVGARLTSAIFQLQRVGSPTGTLTALLYATTTGTYGSDCAPSGPPIATSSAINPSTIPLTMTLITFTFPSGQNYAMVQNQVYVITVQTSTTGTWNVNNYVHVAADSSSPTHSGNLAWFYSGSWHPFPADHVFQVNGVQDQTGTRGAVQFAAYVLPGLVGIISIVWLGLARPEGRELEPKKKLWAATMFALLVVVLVILSRILPA